MHPAKGGVLFRHAHPKTDEVMDKIDATDSLDNLS